MMIGAFNLFVSRNKYFPFLTETINCRFETNKYVLLWWRHIAKISRFWNL